MARVSITAPFFRFLVMPGRGIALHRGDFSTITAAIEAAKPGDRILVRPGLYREGFVVDKPLEIIGDRNRDDVVIEAKGKDVLMFQTTMGRVANLTFSKMVSANANERGTERTFLSRTSDGLLHA